jgi:hypothetical protein
MISVVICFKADVNSELILNIERTIGTDHEILVYSNYNNEGLCKVYNDLARKARYDYMVFVHEDVEFTSFNWGKILIQILADPSIGLAFLCGSVYKSNLPTSWVQTDSKYYRGNVTRYREVLKCNLPREYSTVNYFEIVVGDGCFVSGRREIFKEYPWNEILLKGFHCYDMDISLRVGAKYKLVVVDEIKMIHSSNGCFDKKWLSESRLFHSSISCGNIPRSINLSIKEMKELKYYSHISFLNVLYQLDQSFFEKIKYTILIIYYRPFNRIGWSWLFKLLRVF